MKFLKNSALSLLSLLLFLSVTVFGIAFTAKSTVFNPDFVAGAVDKIDLSSLIKEVAGGELDRQLPEDVGPIIEEALYEIIDEQEPWFKEQANMAIHAVYDYLLGESDTLLVNINLEPLRDDLKESLREKLREIFSQQFRAFAADLPPEQVAAFIDQYYHEIIQQVPKEYLPPELGVLPDELIKTYLIEHYQEIIGYIPEGSIPPELTALLEEQLDLYFDQYFDDFALQYLPAEVEFDENNIPPEVMTQFIMARQYAGYFQLGYNLLIGFMALLVLGIILIARNISNIARTLGITLVTYGAFEYMAVILGRQFMLPQLPLSWVPSSLQIWMQGLYSDFLAPLEMFSLGCLAGGVVLVGASFFFKPRRAEG